MNKKIKKEIKRKIGKKGLKFIDDIKNSLINSKTTIYILKRIVEGFKDAEIKKSLKEEEKCKKSLKEISETMTALSYGALVIDGLYESDSERIKEIRENVLIELNNISRDIDLGLFSTIYDIDEDVLPLLTPIDNFITSRILLAGKLNTQEIDTFFKVRNTMFNKKE